MSVASPVLGMRAMAAPMIPQRFRAVDCAKKRVALFPRPCVIDQLQVQCRSSINFEKI